MKTIKGNLILKKDTTFNESIKVEGDIKGDFNLKVKGNINCRDINCWDINCWDINCKNIDCWDINCKNIDCRDIHCRDINCWDIDCWSINCKNIDCWDIIFCNNFKAHGKVKAKAIIKDRFNLLQKEFNKNGDLK